MFCLSNQRSPRPKQKRHRGQRLFAFCYSANCPFVQVYFFLHAKMCLREGGPRSEREQDDATHKNRHQIMGLEDLKIMCGSERSEF